MPWGKRKQEKIEKSQKKAANMLDNGYTILEVAFKLRKSPTWVAKSGHLFSTEWMARLRAKRKKK